MLCVYIDDDDMMCGSLMRYVEPGGCLRMSCQKRERFVPPDHLHCCAFQVVRGGGAELWFF